jgi:hypothetical protein
VCPQISIFHNEDLPAESAQYQQINVEFFTVLGQPPLGSPGGARKVGRTGVDHPEIGRPA